MRAGVGERQRGNIQLLAVKQTTARRQQHNEQMEVMEVCLNEHTFQAAVRIMTVVGCIIHILNGKKRLDLLNYL